MKTYNPLERKSAGGLPATPRQTPNVDTSTIAQEPEGTQAGNEPTGLEPGEFPLHALSPVMRAFAEGVANVHCVPVALPAMCAVGVVSGALGNAFTLTGAVNGKESHGNLYVIIAAAKSSGKGSVGGVLARPLLEASSELEAEFRQRQLPDLKAEKAVLEKQMAALICDLGTRKTGTGKSQKPMNEVDLENANNDLKSASARLDAIELLLGAFPTYWVGNATSEAMGALFKRNPSGLLCYSAEGGEVVRVLMGKYRADGKADYDLALSGYSVEPFRSDRIGRGSCQITPCFSMLLLVQPTILRELLENDEALERGMTARLLMVIVEPEPQEDDGISRQVREHVQRNWNQLFTDILKRREVQGGTPRLVHCTPAAREVFRCFHNESVQLRRGKYRSQEGELGRWRENAIRQALAFAVADNPACNEVTEDHAQRAVEVVRWFANGNLQITGQAQRRKSAKRADDLHSILVRNRGTETLRNLRDSHGFKPEEVRALAAQFPERFTVERVENQTGKGGHPSEVLRLATLAR